MSDTPGIPDRAEIDQLRRKQLETVQVAFGKALDLVTDFRDLAAQHPNDVELVTLVGILYGTVIQLLNTVTLKIITNGMAADWDKLVERNAHGDSDGTGQTNP